MIVAIADAVGSVSKSMLARYLSKMQRQAGRAVILLDNDPRHFSSELERSRPDQGQYPRVFVRQISGKGMQPELENLCCCFQDIVIDTESRDSMGSRSALEAADLAIIVMDRGQFDTLKCDQLINRLRMARKINPSLRIVLLLEKTGELVQTFIVRVNSMIDALAPVKLFTLSISMQASLAALPSTSSTSILMDDIEQEIEDEWRFLWQAIFAAHEPYYV